LFHHPRDATRCKTHYAVSLRQKRVTPDRFPRIPRIPDYVSCLRIRGSRRPLSRVLVRSSAKPQIVRFSRTACLASDVDRRWYRKPKERRGTRLPVRFSPTPMSPLSSFVKELTFGICTSVQPRCSN
jgi:hypothetical protein